MFCLVELVAIAPDKMANQIIAQTDWIKVRQSD
jgi:hypothetical protein